MQIALKTRLAPPGTAHSYNPAIEQYRGVCALLVMISHGIVHPDMISDHFRWPEIMEYIGAGYLSVLVFFCISGYVIGLNYSQRHLSISGYLKRRLVRLYPVYLVSLLLCLYVAGNVTILTIMENLFFFQNNVPYGNYQVPILVNYVTWSLNYEVIYYLVFIGLFFLRPKIGYLVAGLLLLSVLTIHCSDGLQFLVNYLNGFYFWLLGLMVAWGYAGNSSGDRDDPAIPFLSLVMLHLCQHYLGLGEIIMHLLGIYSTGNVNWLFDLPFCLLVLSILTGKNSVWLRVNKMICYAAPACVFSFLIIRHRLFENDRWIACSIYWVLAILFYFERPVSGWLMPRFTKIGKISYAIYLFHVPVGYLIKRIVFIQNRPLEIAIKYMLWILVTFTLAYLAEVILQPRVKAYFLSNEKNKPVLSEKA